MILQTTLNGWLPFFTYVQKYNIRFFPYIFLYGDHICFFCIVMCIFITIMDKKRNLKNNFNLLIAYFENIRQ